MDDAAAEPPYPVDREGLTAESEALRSFWHGWISRCTYRGRWQQTVFAALLDAERGGGGERLGNFPQAFTHLALILAAQALDQELDRAEHR
ncbi:hypothetical protein ACFYNO_37235 [Kitasatospora sp. NPDC006697]|uniref:hypothetical protein n=1 Tax=Kitasatospora sp. NPDC006697 TaxID=3364020 RepID=UPI003677AF2D